MEENQSAQLALQTAEYNANQPFIKLSNEMLLCTLSYSDIDKEKPLKNNIKHLLCLKSTCKHFNELLNFQTIRYICEEHDIVPNDEKLKNIEWLMNVDSLKFNRLTIISQSNLFFI